MSDMTDDETDDDETDFVNRLRREKAAHEEEKRENLTVEVRDRQRRCARAFAAGQQRARTASYTTLKKLITCRREPGSVVWVLGTAGPVSGEREPGKKYVLVVHVTQFWKNALGDDADDRHAQQAFVDGVFAVWDKVKDQLKD